MSRQSTLGAALITLGAIACSLPAAAQLPLNVTYSGQFISTATSPITFSDTGTLSNPAAPFGLTQGTFSFDGNYTAISNVQDIYNGLVTLAGSAGNTLQGDFVGVFNVDPTTGGGPFSMTGHFTGGSGMFAGVSGPLTATGFAQFTGPGGGILNLTLTGTIVPEPGSLALLIGAGFTTGLLLRRRRSKK